MIEAKFAFGVNDKVWLCLTTLRHRRFAEDLVHLIGLPPGSHVRLRYRRPYVSEETWNMVSNDFVPKDVRIVVALAGTEASTSTNRVAPIRLGRLGSASCEGSVMVLDAVLEGFPKELFPLGTFWEDVTKIAANLPSGFGASAPSEGSYLQQLSRSPRTIATDNSIDAWEEIAGCFFQLDDIASGAEGSRYASFLYYIDGLPERVQNNLAETGALVVEAGSALSLQVHTITRRSQGIIHNPLGEVQVDLAHGSAQLESSRRVRVDSLRDVKSIRIATQALFRRSYGHLSIRKVAFKYESAGSEETATRASKSAEQREEVVVARYDYPLRVGRWRPWLASGMVALAAAIAVFESPESGSPDWTALMLPACAFVLAFFGLALGLRREGGS